MSISYTVAIKLNRSEMSSQAQIYRVDRVQNHDFKTRGTKLLQKFTCRLQVGDYTESTLTTVHIHLLYMKDSSYMMEVRASYVMTG